MILAPNSIGQNGFRAESAKKKLASKRSAFQAEYAFLSELR
jgi:hypothetical protein